MEQFYTLNRDLPITKLENIRKHFGKNEVLKNLCLNVKRGEFISLLGESGSGKTTLLNILGLLDLHNEGEYYLNGVLLNKKTDFNEMRSFYFGFIFQLYYLVPTLNIRQNIMLPYLYRDRYDKDEVEKRFLELVDRLDLKDILDRKCSALSGGEKQRVSIARALIHNPEIIICDEPTGNLDRLNANVVMKILKEENEKGKTILIVTHDELIAKETGKTYYLRGGRLVDVKTTESD